MKKHLRNLKSSRSKGSPERGFTLLEIAVSIVIIGIAFSSLVTLQSYYVKTYVRERNTVKAALAAQYVLSMIELEAEPPDLGAKGGDLVEVLNNYEYFAEDLEDTEKDAFADWTYTQEVTNVEIPLGTEKEQDALRRIDFTVTWGIASAERYALTFFMKTKAD